MNRKMRAKINNKVAKAKKERRPCPLEDSLVFTNGDQPKCDTCGTDLIPVALVALPLVDRPPDKELH